MSSASVTLAEALNKGCQCKTLQPGQLRRQLEVTPGLRGLADQLALTHPHLFSQTAVFMGTETVQALAQAIAVMERVIALPLYQQAALGRASALTQRDTGPAGVFMGYDFHLSAQGPRLIEVNTNAGGAVLNAALARAHRACCSSLLGLFDAPIDVAHLDQVFVGMFRSEWQAHRRSASQKPLRSVVIVDDHPQEQYLAPEFQLVRQLLIQHGIAAAVADPRDLVWRDGALWLVQPQDTGFDQTQEPHRFPFDMPVDLVYNRLTDFDLSEPAHAALRRAYAEDAVAVTPHPRAHALYADKRNLMLLSDDEQLASWGVTQQDRAVLQAVVPQTRAVTPQNAGMLWEQRRQLFFKPVAGYGAKAVYRGDKLTRRVWDEIVAGDFVAQALVPPSARLVDVDGVPMLLKLDLRAYVYRSQIQLLAARTYAGQTTNFRTPGGGFSPVLVLPALNLPSGTAPAPHGQVCAC